MTWWCFNGISNSIVVNFVLDMAMKRGNVRGCTRSISHRRYLSFWDDVHGAEICCSFGYTAWNICDLESSVWKRVNKLREIRLDCKHPSSGAQWRKYSIIWRIERVELQNLHLYVYKSNGRWQTDPLHSCQDYFVPIQLHYQHHEQVYIPPLHPQKKVIGYKCESTKLAAGVRTESKSC